MFGLFNLPKNIAISFILFYQKTLSPDHGVFSRLFPSGYCRYYPSCSEYGKQAIRKYGFFRGSGLAGWRILRCNPWSRGGVDEVR